MLAFLVTLCLLGNIVSAQAAEVEVAPAATNSVQVVTELKKGSLYELMMNPSALPEKGTMMLLRQGDAKVAAVRIYEVTEDGSGHLRGKVVKQYDPGQPIKVGASYFALYRTWSQPQVQKDQPPEPGEPYRKSYHYLPTEERPPFGGLGFHLGIAFNQPSISFTKTSSQTGLLAGVYYDFRLTSFMALSPQVFFIERKGTIQESTVAAYVSNQRYSLRYLEVPLLLKFNAGHGNFVPYLLTGPVGAFLLSAQSEVPTGATGVTNSLDVRDTFKKFDFLWDLGLGFDVRASRSVAIQIEGRYAWGLMNVSDVPGYRYVNKGFEVLFGLRLTPDRRDVFREF